MVVKRIILKYFINKNSVSFQDLKEFGSCFFSLCQSIIYLVDLVYSHLDLHSVVTIVTRRRSLRKFPTRRSQSGWGGGAEVEVVICGIQI